MFFSARDPSCHGLARREAMNRNGPAGAGPSDEPV